MYRPVDRLGYIYNVNTILNKGTAMSKRDLRLERRAILVGKAKGKEVKTEVPSTWTAQRSKEASAASMELISSSYSFADFKLA